MEKWISIKGYEGLYEVSDQGRVRSFRNKEERILKTYLQSSGYEVVCLCVNYKRKKIMVHRLVAIHFLDNPKNKPQINHKNGIKTDNRLINLEWNTPSENSKHAIENGLVNKKPERTKLTEKDILDIRSSNLSLIELSKIYKVNHGYISKIKNRKRWTHI